MSLFTNGTLPLMCALQALRITGEVITTPYSFVATTHALWWNGIKPVFVDIDPITCNIDPNKIEAAITPKTTAIMPVHVYGRPCDTKRIQEIADKYGLKVIYDAAHAFGVMVNGESILNAGNMSSLSFHATKVFNTIEGGALVMKDEQTKKRIDYLKNFGFAGETEIVAPGINGKMDEIRSAYGLLNLKQVDIAIAARQKIANFYKNAFRTVEGVTFMEDIPDVCHNYSYFPIFINAHKYGMTRDELYFRMKERNVLGRRYFYPLISEFSTYRGLESARPENLPVLWIDGNRIIYYYKCDKKEMSNLNVDETDLKNEYDNFFEVQFAQLKKAFESRRINIYPAQNKIDVYHLVDNIIRNREHINKISFSDGVTLYQLNIFEHIFEVFPEKNVVWPLQRSKSGHYYIYGEQPNGRMNLPY